MRGFLKFLKYNQEHISDLKTKKALEEMITHLVFCGDIQGYIASSLMTNKEIIQAYQDYKAEDIETKKIFLPDLFKMCVGTDDKAFVFVQIAITPISVLPSTYIRDDEPFFDLDIGERVKVLVGQNIHENIPTIHTLHVKVPIFLPESILDPKKTGDVSVHHKMNDIISGRDTSTNLENMLLASAERILAVDLLAWPLVFETLTSLRKMAKASLYDKRTLLSDICLSAESNLISDLDPKKTKKASQKLLEGLSEVLSSPNEAVFASAFGKDIDRLVDVYTSPCNVLLSLKRLYLSKISESSSRKPLSTSTSAVVDTYNFLLGESPYLLPLTKENLFVGLSVALQNPKRKYNTMFRLFDNVLGLLDSTKTNTEFGDSFSAYLSELLTRNLSDLLEPMWSAVREYEDPSVGTRSIMGICLDSFLLDKDLFGHLVCNISLMNAFAHLVQNVETTYKTLITLPPKQYFYFALNGKRRENIFGKAVKTPEKVNNFALSLDNVDALLEGLLDQVSGALDVIEVPINERFMDMKDNRGRYFLNMDITLRMRNMMAYDNLLIKIWCKKASGIIWELLDPNNETVNLEYPTLVVLACLLREELENVCDHIKDLNEQKKAKQIAYFKYLQKMYAKQQDALDFDTYVVTWDDLFDSEGSE